MQSFVDENCLVFDQEEESRHCHHDIWKKFNKLIEDVLAKYVSALGLTVAQFIAAVDGGGKMSVVDNIQNYTNCCDDFMAFRKMMLSRNVELEREALAIIYNRPSAEQGLNDLTEEQLIELAIKRSLEEKREVDEFKKAIQESKVDSQVEGSLKENDAPIEDNNTGISTSVEGEGEEEGRSPRISTPSDKKETPGAGFTEEELQVHPFENSPVVDEVQTEIVDEVGEIAGKVETIKIEECQGASHGSVKLSSTFPNLSNKLPPLRKDIGKMRLPTLTAEDLERIENRQSQMRAHVRSKDKPISASPSPGFKTWASQTPKELEKRKQFLLKQKKLLLKNKQLDRAKELQAYDSSKLIDAVEKTTDSSRLKSTAGEPSKEDIKRMKIRKVLAERFKKDFHI